MLSMVQRSSVVNRVPHNRGKLVTLIGGVWVQHSGEVCQGFFKEMLELHKPPSLPSPSLLHPLSPSPAIHVPFLSPFLPFPLPLEVGPPLIAARGSGGEL